MSDEFEVFVTADEAFPAFERAVLSAQRSVVAGFRIFDMTTRLRSAEARAIGETWFDLLAHVIRRGVAFDLTVSDFDPVMATELHRRAWTTVRQGAALAEIADAAPGRVAVRAHMHPARAGLLPRLAFLPLVLRRRGKAVREMPQAALSREAIGLQDASPPDLCPVSHHQKVAVIDDRVLYVGGLDLNDRRYDTPDHDRPSRETWSDVQVIATGKAAREARRHLDTMARVTAGEIDPPPFRRLKRTLSVPRRMQFPFVSPRTVLNEIEQAHLQAFAEARHLIHIETQFFRSRRIADGLAEAAARNRDLSALVILPGAPDELVHDGKTGLDMRFGLSRAQDAIGTVRDAMGERALFAVPVRPILAARCDLATLAGSPMIHVHNKVLVQDDDLVLIGSANLNGRALRWDTELAVDTRAPSQVAAARAKLLSHWWFAPLPAEARAPETLLAWWRREITRNAVHRPENRSGFLVPFDAGKTRDIAQPLPGVTEDIV
ncbi:phosphatidylserine synthase [Thalassococcus sp. CAU 1522]|uniref:Phospholipase D n=1 Tax=Thalassococcus arenae TaxID=2851652 RepID=A0ABS6N305_9RHOB|nr:phospholipase D-like domain-containing protein [Thalassococcus arenae]MBV2358407.1 phosphatidylserine synthase [Thalassococcus arenae]